jgi:Flp pilus assembly protein TadG
VKIRSKLRREEGAAAVEFALIVGLLAMLVFGMMEYGLALWQVQNLRSATREGARVAAVGATTAQIDAAVVNASSGSLPTGFTAVTLSPSGGCPPAGSGSLDQSVTVSLDPASLPSNVRETFTIDVPLLPSITISPTISGTFRCEV